MISTIEIYADGANFDSMVELNDNPAINGFTTNPTLMRKAGIKNYEEFAKKILSVIKDKPISFEIFTDNFFEAKTQAYKIASWGDNVYVKIPVMAVDGTPNFELIEDLSKKGIKVNATAITEFHQINAAINSLRTGVPSIISIFAGRIADTGTNPESYIAFAHALKQPYQKILWASTREAYNIIQAERSGADIITITDEILNKIKKLWNKPLLDVSLDIVQTFYRDAQESGFTL